MSKQSIICLLMLIGFAYGQVDLKTQQCNVIENTTAEVRMYSTYDVSTPDGYEIMYRTQSFTNENGQTVRLLVHDFYSCIEVYEVTSNNAYFYHSEEACDVYYSYIDSKDEWIFTTNHASGSTKIERYYLKKIVTGADNTLTPYMVSSTQDFDRTRDLTMMNVTKLLSIADSYLYFILTAPCASYLFSIFPQDQDALQYVATISSTTSLNIIAGNPKAMFDANSNGFYVQKADSTTQYEYKSLTDLGIQTCLISTVQFVQFTLSYSIGFSTTTQKTCAITVDLTGGVSTTPIQMDGEARQFTDNYKNLILVSEKDLVWFRLETGGIFVFQLSKSTQDDELKKVILSRFQTYISSISFDGDTAIMLASFQDSYEDFSLVSFKLDSETGQMTILDDYPNILDRRQIDTKSAQFRFYFNNYACNCLNYVFDKLNCNGKDFKCIAQMATEQQDCTKAAGP